MSNPEQAVRTSAEAGPTTPRLAATIAHYRYIVAGATAVILFVFFEPTFRRLATGTWQRGRFVYVGTTSLDVHAVVGYTFVFLVVAQVVLGFRLAGGTGRAAAHRKLGRVLFALIIPLFVAAAAWVVLDRSTSISPEQSVIFKVDRPIGRVVLFELLAFICVFSLRSYRAARRRAFEEHVDALLGAFMVAAAIAIIRFLYFLFWAVRGGSPFSVLGMFFITVTIVFATLVFAYARAGRLRENAGPLGALAVVTLAIATLGAGHYEFMDVPR